jgi:hypothetical protein
VLIIYVIDFEFRKLITDLCISADVAGATEVVEVAKAVTASVQIQRFDGYSDRLLSTGKHLMSTSDVLRQFSRIGQRLTL